MKLYLSPICNFYAYTLLPIHLHFLIKIKTEQEILDILNETDKFLFEKYKADLPTYISKQFSNFLNSYARSFNIVYNRKGSLFINNLKRSLVKEASNFRAFLFYIPKNAVHHGYTKTIGNWTYDSYNALIEIRNTMLLREEVFNWFGGKDGFLEFHKQEVFLKRGNLMSNKLL